MKKLQCQWSILETKDDPMHVSNTSPLRKKQVHRLTKKSLCATESSKFPNTCLRELSKSLQAWINHNIIVIKLNDETWQMKRRKLMNVVLQRQLRWDNSCAGILIQEEWNPSSLSPKSAVWDSTNKSEITVRCTSHKARSETLWSTRWREALKAEEAGGGAVGS